MPVPIQLQEIPGAAELYDWFGYWPTFHDAEIISLQLNRKGCSNLHVHTWDTTKEIDDKGYYVLARHAVVEFAFEGVCALDLNGFNQQNVILGLNIEKIDSGFRLTLNECYGFGGSIESEKVPIRLLPGKPA